MAKPWIGTSGFAYGHWRDIFYPKGLPQAKWFDYYVQHFNSVELNVTFYRLPRRTTFEGWAQRAPRDFRFAIKGSRFITHMRRLSQTREALQTLLEVAEPLGDRLACVIWQLPPGFGVNVERLRNFIEDIAKVERAQRTRHAFEFRDPSWLIQDVFQILRGANGAVVLADAPLQVLPPGVKAPPLGRPVVRVPLTADWAYLRRHGPGEKFRNNYPFAMVQADAQWIGGQLREGRDIFAFYNNDVGGFAVKNAQLLRELVSKGSRGKQQSPGVNGS